MQPITRRSLLGGALAAGAAGGLAPRATAAEPAGSTAAAPSVAFYGAHQAGIATSPPGRLSFAAFDVVVADRGRLRALLQAWTAAAERMTRGLPPEPGRTPVAAPPADSGEVLGIGSAKLTVTFGFGPGLFDHRLGLAAARPRALRPLPALPIDRLDPDRSGGDLMVQACADDALVAFHAIRHLRHLGEGVVRLRWVQQGFGATARTRRLDGTPRNLFGMKDGTLNPTVDDPDFDSVVWVQPGDRPAWLADGSFAVVRRIRMRLEHWDASTLDDQQRTIGRFRLSGAPLSGGEEFTPPEFTARDARGRLCMPADCHVRLAHPDYNNGAQMLRRGYNYDDGVDRSGNLDAGLFFIAYARDPDTQLVPILTKLAHRDALNEYTVHTTSAVFAVPPGARAGGYVGETLLS